MESAGSLQQHIDREVESSPDLAGRLERLQSPLDSATTELDELATGVCDKDRKTEKADAGDATPTRSGSPVHGASGDDGVAETKSSVQENYDVVLAATRIYARVEHREADAISSIFSDRSHAWSALSGLSLAQVSTVSVIQLPLYQSELERFQRLASPSATGPLSALSDPSVAQRGSQGTYSALVIGRRSRVIQRDSTRSDGWLRQFGIVPEPNRTRGCPYIRLYKEWIDITSDPSGTFLAKPISNNMVYSIASLSFLSRLTTTSSLGKGLSLVLYVCHHTCNTRG